MAKQRFGVAIEDELVDAIDAYRETDQMHPDFQHRSAVIQELLTYGLAVAKCWDALAETGEFTDDPYVARNLVYEGMSAVAKSEMGIPLADPGVQRMPYSWEREDTGGSTPDI